MLKVHNLKKSFGGVKAVDIDEIFFEQNQLTSIIGPNGAGKTTFFDLISGFIEGDKGKVFLNDKNITNSQPYTIAREGMVRTFQLTKVFDRMTVVENMMFSGSDLKNDSLFSSFIQLPAQKKKENLLRKKAFDIMKDLNIDHMADSYARELSGGQKKLLELGRSIINEPSILLLDEPLSALDLKLRQRMRTELREIQKRVNITFIYITHDQGEALTMSDRIAVMNEGELEQIGKCDEVYNNPLTPFVATFVGENNPLYGKVTGIEGDKAKIETADGQYLATMNESKKLNIGDESIAFVRPESLFIPRDGDNFDNKIDVNIESFEFEGNLKNFYASLKSGAKIKFSVPNAIDTSSITSGSSIVLGFESSKSVILPKASLAID